MAIMALSILAKKRRSDQVRFSVPQLPCGKRALLRAKVIFVMPASSGRVNKVHAAFAAG